MSRDAITRYMLLITRIMYPVVGKVLLAIGCCFGFIDCTDPTEGCHLLLMEGIQKGTIVDLTNHLRDRYQIMTTILICSFVKRKQINTKNYLKA